MLAAIALGLSLILFAATGLFYLAPEQAAHGIPWAVDACTAAPGFCDHPEWCGLAGIGMAVAHMALKGIGA
jgi:hypothetical protein